MDYNAVPQTRETRPTKWRPRTLYTTYLTAFTAVTAFLAISIELIILGCSDHGCYMFGKNSVTHIPAASKFVYNQIPTIIALVLSNLWVLSHHDIIRLEPYFRMSMKGGARATDSLFLDYPYTPGPFLSIKAGWKRHYVVAISSVILSWINFFIIPVVPNIFDETIPIVPFPDNATRLSLDTSRNVSADFTFLSYDFAWHNGSLPPFSTDRYALLPVESGARTFSVNETWIGETELFEAEMRCEEAQPPRVGYFNNLLTINITSADGVDEVRVCDLGAAEQERLGFDGWGTDCHQYSVFVTPWTSISHHIPSTGSRPESYMYAWASGAPPSNTTGNFTSPAPINITAIFCTPSYYSEAVSATVAMPSGKVLDITRTGIRSQITTPRGFNGIMKGEIEQDFSGQVLDTNGDPVGFGYPQHPIMDLDVDLQERFGTNNATSNFEYVPGSSRSSIFLVYPKELSAFALFNQTSETLSQLLHAETLGSLYHRALQIQFAFAVATEMVRGNNTNQVAVVRMVPIDRVTVNKLWARAAGAGLWLIVLLTAMLIFLIRQRPCELDGEPNSLAESLRLLSTSPGLREVMENAEFHDPQKLLKVLEESNTFFKLEVVDGKGPAIRLITGTPSIRSTTEEIQVIQRVLLSDPDTAEAAVIEEVPWALRGVTGVAFFSSFTVLALLLIASFAYSRAHNGFPMPGGPNSFGSKFLFTYIPILLGMTIEPMLIALGSSQCMLGPYEELIKGSGKDSYAKALAVDYDRSPPNFQLVRSLQTGHIKLAALTVAILLSNVLAVTLVGVYTAVSENRYKPRSHKIIKSFPGARQEMYFELARNLSGFSSQTWTTPEYYIDPPYILPPNGEDTYNTVGFGADITCTPISKDRITFPCSAEYGNMTKDYCEAGSGFPEEDNYLAILDPCGIGGADDRWLVWNSFATDYILHECTDKIFPVWVENLRFKTSTPLDVDDYYFVALNCTLTDNLVNLTATVKEGQVLSVSNVNPFNRTASLYSTDMSSAIPLSHSFADVLATSIKEEAPSLGSYPVARVNYLMATLNDDVLRQPSNETHVPNSAVAAEVFADTLRRLFAILVRICADEIFATGTDSESAYQRTYKVRVNTLNFALSVAILLFAIGVIVVLYWGKERDVVGHLPKTLAASYSQLYASNVIEKLERIAGPDRIRIAEQMKESGGTYKYGRFADGRHYGVYWEEGSGGPEERKEPYERITEECIDH